MPHCTTRRNPGGWAYLLTKTNEWREEKVTSILEQTVKGQSISRDMQHKRINNKIRTLESVLIMRFGHISRKLD